MANDSNIVGFIDIGTNSIHLLVMDFVKGTMGVEIAREKEVITLGRHLYKYGEVDEDSLKKLHLIVDTFTKYAQGHGAKKVYAMATCACREANNQEALMKALDIDGLTVRIIPGEEEARLIRIGVLEGAEPEVNTLLIDIGGGSTELSVSNGKKTLFIDSLPLGAVRFAYSYPYDPEGPLTDQEYSSYQHNVDLHSYRAVKAIKELGYEECLGSSGTLEALADICSELYNSDPQYLKYSDLTKLTRSMVRMTLAEKLALPKLTPNRADIIVAGAAIAEELMYLLGMNYMKVVRRGLKEGMVMDYLEYRGLKNLDVRESSIRELAERFSYNKEHADEVGKYAVEIFDGLRDLGLHSMDNNIRDLLYYASLLHDIGEYVSYDRHHISSYNIISYSNILGFDYSDINKIALMARFHHKKMPSEKEKLLSRYSERERKDLRRCTLILRIADAIDRHHLRLVESLAITRDGGTVTFTMHSHRSVEMEIWKINGYSNDFKELFGCRLEVEAARHRT